MSSYLRLTVQQLSSLSDGEPIVLTGRYFRHAANDHLEQGDGRVILIGLPFSWMPPQGARIEIWGRLIRGQRLYLQVHDARPHGSSKDVPELLSPPATGQELVLTVRVIDIGNTQLALTADGRFYVLVGDELDGRTYCLHGRLLTLAPPTVEVIQAVPVMS